jgi:REP element-mobilizing transposase RayT
VSAPPAAQIQLPAEDDEEEEENDVPPISELLGDVPPPIPPHPPTTPKMPLPWEQPRSLPLQPQPVMAVDEPKTTPPPQWTEPLKNTPVTGFSRETSPAVLIGGTKQSLSSMDETVVSRFSHSTLDTETRTDQIPDDLAVTRKHEFEKDPQAVIETRPQAISESVTEVAHRILLEPASPDLVNLSYACLLIPRFEHHHLIGDASERLAEWVPNVCIAFGWRLEHMAVRPEYLQWVVRVPPSTAPGYIMRIIRQQTSERLFNEFPKFKADNIGGDFWAPGYLIMGSSQSHPQKLVRDFIRQTRDRQGISR